MNTQRIIYSFALVLVSILGLYGQRSITLVDEFDADQTNVVFNYQSWDGQDFWTGLDGATFQHALDVALTNPSPNGIINYVNWEGLKFSAKVDGDVFIDAPNGDFSRAIPVDEINYRTIDGRKWTASLKPYNVVRPPVVVLINKPFIITGTLPSPVFVIPPPIQIGSLLDVFPDQSPPFLLDDLGFFDYTINEDGTTGPWPLTQAMGALADTALLNFTTNLEVYKTNLADTSAAAINVNNVRERIRVDDGVKASVNALLYLLMLDAIVTDSDQSDGTVAIRNWCAKIYKEQNVNIAKNTLLEYDKWKEDPCAYPGAFCPSKQGSLLAAPKPPIQLIAENGAEVSVSGLTSIAGTLAIAGGVIGQVVTAQVVLIPLIGKIGGLAVTSPAAAAGTGSAAGAAAGGVFGNFGGTVVAGPAGIIVAAAVILILESINIAQSENARRRFDENVTKAQNEIVNIIDVVNNNPSILRLAFFRISTTPVE